MAVSTLTLKDKVAIITGGGTGLGKAMALSLAREGADIVVAARRLGPIEQTASEVREMGRRALSIPTDTTDSKQVNNMIDNTVDKMGKLDILINNAGAVGRIGVGNAPRYMWDIPDEEWLSGINSHLSSVFYCCRRAAKYMVAQHHGKIINIASINGLRGWRNGFAYGAAKAGVINLTRTLAHTFSRDNIQVNCIAPGLVDVRQLQPEPETQEMPLKADFFPVGRYGVPDDIGNLALFLASDASDYINGALFVNDGGGIAAGVAPTGYAPVVGLKENQHGF